MLEKSLVLPFAITGSNKDAVTKKTNIGYSARITLNRQDFGMNWHHKSDPNFVGDNIDVEIDLITRAIEEAK
jgi:polyisoprenoid-binding protein YceI